MEVQIVGFSAPTAVPVCILSTWVHTVFELSWRQDQNLWQLGKVEMQTLSNTFVILLCVLTFNFAIIIICLQYVDSIFIYNGNQLFLYWIWHLLIYSIVQSIYQCMYYIISFTHGIGDFYYVIFRQVLDS